MMIDGIILIIVICLVGSALFYIQKEKKKGVKCVGCPDACSCQKKKSSCHDEE